MRNKKGSNWYTYPNGTTRTLIGQGPPVHPNHVEPESGQAPMPGELMPFALDQTSLVANGVDESEEMQGQVAKTEVVSFSAKQRGQKRGRSASEEDDFDDPTPRSKRRITTTTTKNNPKGLITVAPYRNDRSVRSTSDPSQYQDETYGSLAEQATAFNHSVSNIFTQTSRRA